MKLSASRWNVLATLASALSGIVAAAPIATNTTSELAAFLAADTSGLTAFSASDTDTSEPAAFSAADLFRRQAGPAAYTGPTDSDGLPTFDGTLEYAIANWPDPERVQDSVFWTGGSADRGALTSFIQNQLKGQGLWFEQVFQPDSGRASARFIEDAQFGKSDSVRLKATARSSQAFAQYSSGTAWLLIPKGVSELDPYPGKSSVDEPGGTGRFANWVSFEYNTLTRNALIGKIVRVNPNDFSDQQTLWTSGDPAFGDPATTTSNTKPVWLSVDGISPQSQIESANDGV